MLMALVQEYLEDNGKDITVFRGFMKRFLLLDMER